MKHTFYYKRHTFFFYYALFMAVFGLIRVFSGSSFIISFSLITPGFIFIVVANGFRQKRIEIASGELKCYNAFNYQSNPFQLMICSPPTYTQISSIFYSEMEVICRCTKNKCQREISWNFMHALINNFNKPCFDPIEDSLICLTFNLNSKSVF